MKKPKIAISLSESLLKLVDSKVDGSIIRSRSQAIEYFLNKGLKESSLANAVILLKGSHQDIALKKVNGKSLIKHQFDFFSNHGIKKVYLITKHSEKINEILNEISDSKLAFEIINDPSKGTVPALKQIKDKIKDSNFVVLSGDTFIDFNLSNMLSNHNRADRLATMGLITSHKPTKYGNATLSGELIINFEEKPSTTRSYIINAGIYIFNSNVLEILDNNTSLEMEIFPKLAKIKQLVGFFTHGEYVHLGD